MSRLTMVQIFWLGSVALCAAPIDIAQGAEPEATSSAVTGAELFQREWVPQDPRSHGGDGLGPVFNDSSCVACHNQGGPGGAGPASKNVDIVSAFLNKGAMQRPTAPSAVGSLLRSAIGLKATPGRPQDEKSRKLRREFLLQEARRIHPGFTNARSVVVHLFGTDDEYLAWRKGMLTPGFAGQFGGFQPNGTDGAFFLADDVQIVTDFDSELEAKRISDALMLQHMTRVMTGFVPAGARIQGNFTLSTTQRNPTALFGVGVIDAIPDSALLAAAATKHSQFPKVSGRVARLPGDKIGRFGWKAQKATLRSFAMAACAVELGLHVPDHPQAGHPSQPKYQPTGFDMDQRECDLLVDYLRQLPSPAADVVGARTAALAEGKQLFTKVGCAACHVESLGEVTGIYSDLLLHDMGDILGDTGSYGVFIPNSPGGDAEGVVPPLANADQRQPLGKSSAQPILGATRLEWRTPPLWGVRDSAPYLHDGRAKTLEQAIAFHAGEGQKSATRFFALDTKQRLQLIGFLKSLVAPRQVAQRP